ncbi:putative programmed cell death protein 5 [Blattamonas nauphoetae]|uniref:Programmed cell death protein 5 n=1 Tax=Blattamonas nauphoetae TaxID=2049346 RepID=A0ABQ9XCB8_9EUKA|nr:putative programmed cell death protein 5 [Blattamonas nauphoetae]
MDLQAIQSQLKSQGDSGDKSAEKAQQQAAMEDRKNQILHQILTPAALERLNRIGVVKPEEKMQLEQMLIRSAGQFSQQLGEDDLVEFLDQVRGAKKEVKVTIKRKTTQWDEDDDDDF